MTTFYTTTMYKDEANELLKRLRSKADADGRASKFDPLVKHMQALTGNNVLRIEPLSVTDVTQLRSYVARNVKGGERLKIQSRRIRGSDAKKFRAYVSRA